jgi:hypothetical protein
MSMRIRDRIKELRRVPARDLLPNPKNWRSHPAAQRWCQFSGQQAALQSGSAAAGAG